VFWPQGSSAAIDWPSVLIAAAAAFALFRLRLGAIPVIAGCGLAGLAWHLARS
jgi:chromate transporter